MFDRRSFTAAALSTALVPSAAFAKRGPLEDALQTILFGSDLEFRDAISMIRARGKPDMAAGLLLALRFTRGREAEIGAVLNEITGQKHGEDWFEWMLWQEKATDIEPHASYVPFKRAVFARIDPQFDDFLKPEYLKPERMKIRLEEIAWGGVRKDGIPSLDNPDLIAAGEADYLRESDLVFGVEINGDQRAYPLRIMGWHEMFNDVIGGVPVALAYCTLCGSGILFETKRKGRKNLVFGSSGFLYRSNKLMFDRETHSLWNQFTGKPVVGPLVDSGIELAQRPVVITTWKSWRESHPETKVLSVQTGHQRDYGPGVVYRDYFASPELMFPAHVDQRRHKQKDYVFAIREFGAARAWPLNAFVSKPVINDAIGNRPVVLIGSPDTRSVRAYERGGLSFRGVRDGLNASDGSSWRVVEDALIGPDGQRLPRVAGHIAYWFAWDNYMQGVSTVYDG